jgi:putative transposase
MAWKELRVEQQRLLMIEDHEEGASISELSEIYAISRKTVYKWLERHKQRGAAGLTDLSRRPHESPSQICPEAEKAIVKPASAGNGDHANCG